MRVEHKTTRKERRQKRIAHLKTIKMHQKDGTDVIMREVQESPRTFARCSGVYNSVFCRY